MKAIKFYHLWMLMMLTPLMNSCTEEIEIDLDSSFDRLIVYGEISTDTTSHKIRLVKSADYFFNKPAIGISGAQVSISDGYDEVTLTESPLEAGIYETSSTYFGIAGKTYSLKIMKVDVDNDGVDEVYKAQSYLPEVATPDSIRVNYVSFPFFEGAEIQLFALDPAETTDYYAFKISKNGVMQTDSLPEITVQSDLLFNGNYTNGVGVLFLDNLKPGENINEGDTLDFEMIGITSDYYNFVIEAQTTLFGSNPLFSGPPANVSTNLSNGALGYFTAVNTKRIRYIVPKNENTL